MAAPYYTELDPSPEVIYYENGRGETHCKCIRKLYCHFDDLSDMVAWLYTDGRAYPGHGGGAANALVREIRPVPLGAIGGTTTQSDYEWARVQVIYSTEGPQLDGSGNAVDESFGAQQFYVRPPAKGYWGDGVAITAQESALGIPVLGAYHKLRYSSASSAPSDPFQFIGSVNSASRSAILFASYTFAAQTVLYGPPEIGVHSDYSGGTKYTYTYHHLINPFGWNNFWNSRGNAWQGVYTDKAHTEPYIQYPLASW